MIERKRDMIIKKMKKKQKVLRVFLVSIIVIAVYCCLLGGKVVTRAAGQEIPLVELEDDIIPASGMMQTGDNTVGYERPDIESAVIYEIEKGQKVMVSGRTENGWCQVAYQGKMMFLQESSLQEVVNEELLIEMDELEKVRRKEAEQDILERKETLRSRIWGIVVVTLITGIFLIGIVGVVRSEVDREENLDEE